jgi:hypothetical protein
VNIKYNANSPSLPNSTASKKDPDIVEFQDRPPRRVVLSLTETGVKSVCSGGNYKVFRKCFSKGICNFDTTSVPQIFKGLETSVLKPKGFHGYQSLANLLRPSAEDEPFISRPVAGMVQKKPKNYQKLKAKYFEDGKISDENLLKLRMFIAQHKQAQEVDLKDEIVYPENHQKTGTIMISGG